MGLTFPFWWSLCFVDGPPFLLSPHPATLSAILPLRPRRSSHRERQAGTARSDSVGRTVPATIGGTNCHVLAIVE